MAAHWLLVGALRGALVLGLARLALVALGGAAASTRRLVVVVALFGALLVPLISALAPSLRLPAPPTRALVAGSPVAEALVEGAVPERVVRLLAAPREGVPARGRWSVDVAIVAIWAAGCLAFAARVAAGAWRARGIVLRSRSAGGAWARSWARAERMTGRKIAVRVTDELSSPAVVGVWRPVVLVPKATEDWCDRRRDAALLHESAHVERHDYLMQIVAHAACALHWFDPLAWALTRRLRVERELAADDIVLARGVSPAHYAEDLLAAAGVSLARDPASVGAPGMVDGTDFAARVAALVIPGRARRPLPRSVARMLVGFSAAALLVVACTEAPRPPASGGEALATPATPAPPSTSSSIDPGMQAAADQEADRLVAEWSPARVAVLVLDPARGEVLADAGRSHGALAEVAAREVFPPGSTIKTMLLAAAFEEGVVSPADRFDCGQGKRSYGDKTLHDAGSYGTLSLGEMLAVSTNVGFSRVFDRLGGERYGRWLTRFGYGTAPPLAGAAAGQLPPRLETGTYEGAVGAIGHALRASPLQVAAAYAAIANGGVYLSPTTTKRASVEGERVLRPETARAVMTTLEQAVANEHSTASKARLEGVRVAGKTGTSDLSVEGGGEATYASFVGVVPAERPRWVIVVGVEAPRGAGSGGEVAAPAFARVAARLLAR